MNEPILPIARLHQWIAPPRGKASNSQIVFWLSLSLTFAVTYSLLGLASAFSSPYVFHDDARSHVFWMRRFLDPELFQGDLIADYFQSVAPYGYATLYHIAASLGIDPLVFSKLLPPILALIATAYCFGTCWAIFPVPAAGFLTTLLLNQTFWSTSDLPSGTPRAFLYPLFLAFLYYLLRRSLLPCLAAIALQGLFYPQCLFLSAGVLTLRLLRVENWRLRLSGERRNYLFWAAGIGTCGIMLLPYALRISEYGPVITAAEARQLPTFQEYGRKNFFYDNPWKYWVCTERSGMFPFPCREIPPQFWASLLLPLLLLFRQRFPLLGQLTHHAAILPQILLASLGMFCAAHLMLFKLHLPSRYTMHSFRIAIAIAAAIALVTIVDAVFRACTSPYPGKPLLAMGFLTLLSALILASPQLVVGTFPNADYSEGESRALYQFLTQQPKDILVASVSEEANNIPTLAQRSVLVSGETAAPYHLGYYRQIQQRLLDLMQAQYAPDLAVVQAFVQQYGIDFFLLDRDAFTPDYIQYNRWLIGVQPIATEAIAMFQQGKLPALATLTEHCAAFDSEDLVVLEAGCILSRGSEEVKK